MTEKINLSFFNIGAVIGAVIGLLLAVAFWYSMEWDFSRRSAKFGITIPILGYFVGSFLWDMVFAKKEE